MNKIIKRTYSEKEFFRYKCISAYEEVERPEEWLNCPRCGLKPLVWTFDNGRSTACGCGDDQYRHFTIQAESVMSIIQHSHNGRSAVDYNVDELRDNWNHWCKTGEIKFIPFSNENETRW